MNKKIFMQELVDGLSARKDIQKKDADAFVRAVFEIIEEYLAKDNVVKIKGLGTFKLVEVNSRESVNVNTGERIKIDGHSKISFTPDSLLRDHINKPFAEFTTIVINEGTDLKEMERIDMPVEPLEDVVPEDTTDPVATEEPSIQIEQADVAEPIEEPEPVDVPEPEPVQSAEPVVVETTTTQHVETQHVEQMMVTTQHVENQTIQQITPASTVAVPASAGVCSLGWCGICSLVLLFVLMMCASFYGGYHYALNSATQKNTVEIAPVPVKPVIEKKDKPVAPRLSEEEQQAKDYKQIEDGEYLIVGTQEVHTMSVGDNLYKIANKAYGDKSLARYITFYNEIGNPDVIPLGKEIKLPKLIKKSK